MNLDSITNNISETILKAGNYIREERVKFQKSSIEEKGYNDFVSYVDRTAESILMEACEKLTPGCGFLNEETGIKEGNEFRWIIDPLDGTTNFIFGIPIYSVSVCLEVSGILELGFVYDPNQDEFFTARRGSGAYLMKGSQKTKLQVTQTRELSRALVGTGFPHRQFEILEPYLGIMKQLFQNTRGIRRTGSAAIDLAYTAAGRFDAFFEFDLSPWDIAAGIVLIREAGGKVTNFKGSEDLLMDKTILASTPEIYSSLKELMQRGVQSK